MRYKGFKHTKETKRKLSEKMLSRVNPMENPQTRKKLSDSLKGREPWNKGIRYEQEFNKRFIKGWQKRKEAGLGNAWNKGLVGVTASKKKGKTFKELYGDRTEGIKAKIRKARMNQKFPKKSTSIELKIQSLLELLHIPYQTHKAVMGITQPDFFIEPNTCIYCDGDYWHNLPEVIQRDKKINDVLKFGGYKVIRLWEHQIKLMNSYDLKKEIWGK